MTTSGKTILIVDDSLAIRLVLGELARSVSNHQIREASSGIDAIRLLQNEPVHFLFTDLNMPQMTGLELLSFVKSSPRHRHIKVVAFSSDTSPADQDRCKALGAVAFIPKPFDRDQVRERLRTLLAESGDVPLSTPDSSS